MPQEVLQLALSEIYENYVKASSVKVNNKQIDWIKTKTKELIIFMMNVEKLKKSNFSLTTFIISSFISLPAPVSINR